MKLFSTYGTKEGGVYFYNHGVEVDFYVPQAETAIQACYTMNDAQGTFERETLALVKVQSRLSCRRNIIVTFSDEGVIEKEGVKIEIIPVWKFLLGPL